MLEVVYNNTKVLAEVNHSCGGGGGGRGEEEELSQPKAKSALAGPVGPSEDGGIQNSNLGGERALHHNQFMGSGLIGAEGEVNRDPHGNSWVGGAITKLRSCKPPPEYRVYGVDGETREELELGWSQEQVRREEFVTW